MTVQITVLFGKGMLFICQDIVIFKIQITPPPSKTTFNGKKKYLYLYVKNKNSPVFFSQSVQIKVVYFLTVYFLLPSPCLPQASVFVNGRQITWIFVNL